MKISSTANMDIRQQIRALFIPQWQVAQQIGINEVTLCRWLRSEMKPEQRQRVQAAIDEIRKSKEGVKHDDRF